MPARSDDDESPEAGAPAEPHRERLQKVMAAAGVGSRRHCEELIEQGRVEVDRRFVTELGTTVDPESQEIRVDGTRLQVARKVYFLVNKPPGYLSTNNDPSGRPLVLDLLPPTKERLFTVGRLDMSSEGLMLVTNDGALADKLTHPRYGIEKTYLAQVAGQPTQEQLDKLVRGVHLAEGVARCVRVSVRSEIKQSTLLEIVLAEGKNREIRRILARVGHKVMKLRRIAIGGLRLKDLKLGEFRRLSTAEVKMLTRHAPAAKKRRHKGSRRPPAVRGAARYKSEGTIIGGDGASSGNSASGSHGASRPPKHAQRSKHSKRPNSNRPDSKRSGKPFRPGAGSPQPGHPKKRGKGRGP